MAAPFSASGEAAVGFGFGADFAVAPESPESSAGCDLLRFFAERCGELAFGFDGGEGVSPPPMPGFHVIGFPPLCWQSASFAACSARLARRDSLIDLTSAAVSLAVSRRVPTFTSTTRR